MQTLNKLLIILLFLSALNACGGGGKGGSEDSGNVNQQPTGSSNWDEMRWDRDNWA